MMDSSSDQTHHKHLDRTLCVFMAVIIIVTLINLLLIAFFCRCFRRHTDHPITPTPGDALAALPVIIYGAPPSPSSRPSCSSAFESDNCVICLGEFEYGNLVRVLPCKHIFHKDCIDQWLPFRSSSCPICRNLTIEVQDGEPTRMNCSNGGTGNASALLVLNFANNVQMPSYL